MGEGGGRGRERSMTGGSFLTVIVSLRFTDLRPFVRGRVGDSQTTSRGGVKRSAGGSYGKSGVVERRGARRCEDEGRMKSALGLVWWGDGMTSRLVGDSVRLRRSWVGVRGALLLDEARRGEDARATKST